MIAQSVPSVQRSPFAAGMLLCWATGEVIRYPWYAATVAGKCPAWLTWLRYSAFIPIYPAGVVSELVVMYQALQPLAKAGLWSVSMPNKWNFGFDYVLFMKVVMALYPFLWWQLYSSLLRQRVKKLGNGKKEM